MQPQWVTKKVNSMKNTTPPNTSRDLQTKISLLVDGELDRPAQADLIERMKACPDTMQLYKNQIALKKVISEKVERKCCGEELKDALRSKIRGL